MVNDQTNITRQRIKWLAVLCIAMSLFYLVFVISRDFRLWCYNTMTDHGRATGALSPDVVAPHVGVLFIWLAGAAYCMWKLKAHRAQ